MVDTWVFVMLWVSTVLFCVFEIFHNENNRCERKRKTRSPAFVEAFKQRLYKCLWVQ